MPLGLSDNNVVEPFHSSPFSIRNNMKLKEWTVGDSTKLGDEVDMIILRWEAGIGFIPPIQNKKQLLAILTQNKSQIPVDSEGWLETVMRLGGVWISIWFIPVFAADTTFAQRMTREVIPENRVYQTFIRKESIGGSRNTTGFTAFEDNVRGMGKNLCDVVATPRFKTAYTNAYGDMAALDWTYRTSGTEDEGERVASAKEWLKGLIEAGTAEQTLYLPEIATDQFEIVPAGALRMMSKAQIDQKIFQIFMDSNSQLSQEISGSSNQSLDQALGLPALESSSVIEAPSGSLDFPDEVAVNSVAVYQDYPDDIDEGFPDDVEIAAPVEKVEVAASAKKGKK